MIRLYVRFHDIAADLLFIVGAAAFCIATLVQGGGQSVFASIAFLLFILFDRNREAILDGTRSFSAPEARNAFVVIAAACSIGYIAGRASDGNGALRIVIVVAMLVQATRMAVRKIRAWVIETHGAGSADSVG